VALALGVDVGGTKVAAGVVDEDGLVVARARRATPSTDVDAIMNAVEDVVAELTRRYPVTAVGIGAAGWIANDRSTVMFAPNLAWRDEPLRARLTERLGSPVRVENDGATAAWGEHRFGAGRGVDDLAVVTVGTGIGAGWILGGQLYRGGYGVAAEPGHVRVVPDGIRCGCGNRGCWEQYASGRALEREAQELARTSPASAGRMLELAGGDPDKVAGPEITRAAQEGDPAALDCFHVVGTWLGQGLADLAAVLDPTRIVVGGGVSDAEDLLLTPAREAFLARLSGRGHRPAAELVRATLGNDAGLVGAADLARLDTA
jgi:glucokinase